LYTGRIAVAQAALAYRKELFRRTKAYSDNKPTYAPPPPPSTEGGKQTKQPMLSDIPQLRALYEENEEALASVEAFVSQCEKDLSAVLRDPNAPLPSPSLIEAIAVAKVKAVEDSIAFCFRLKQEVGSFALMRDSGFRHLDFLQCCKFAEGDSRILMQKLARDRLKLYMKRKDSDGSGGGSGGGGLRLAEEEEEEKRCEDLALKLAAHGKDQATNAASSSWTAEWRAVYALADATINRVLASAGKRE